MKEIFDDFKSTFWKEERVLEYQQIARENGFRINDRERFAEQNYQLKQFELFKGKRGKRLSGILGKKEKQSSLKTRVYDYMYYGNPKKRISTVFEFCIPQLGFSKMLIRPKSRMNKMKGFFKKEKPLFPNVKNFNQKYRIQNDKSVNLRYELNEEFLDLLSDQDQLWMEAAGNYVLFYYKDRAIPLGELMFAYEYVLDLLDRLLHGHSSEEYV